jgi:hypothetical protein
MNIAIDFIYCYFNLIKLSLTDWRNVITRNNVTLLFVKAQRQDFQDNHSKRHPVLKFRCRKGAASGKLGEGIWDQSTEDKAAD